MEAEELPLALKLPQRPLIASGGESHFDWWKKKKKKKGEAQVAALSALVGLPGQAKAGQVFASLTGLIKYPLLDLLCTTLMELSFKLEA